MADSFISGHIITRNPKDGRARRPKFKAQYKIMMMTVMMRPHVAAVFTHCTCFVWVGHGSGPCWFEESRAGVSEVCGATASHLGAPGAITLSATNHHHFPLLKSRRLSSALSVTSGVLSWVCSSALILSCRLVIAVLWWLDCSSLPSRQHSLAQTAGPRLVRRCLCDLGLQQPLAQTSACLRYKLHQNLFFFSLSFPLMCCLSF